MSTILGMFYPFFVERTGGPLGMPKSRDLYNHLLPGFSGNSNPGIF